VNGRERHASLTDACAALNELNPLYRRLQMKKDYRFGSFTITYAPREVWSVGDATAAGLSAACLRLLQIGTGR